MPILSCVQALARRDDEAHVTHESWTDYVRRITHGVDRKHVAAAAGMNVSGLSRWLNGTTRPSPEKVISLARGLNHPPCEALVAAGYLEPGEVVGAVEIVQSTSELSDEALIDELYERLRKRAPQSASDVLGPIPSFSDNTEGGRATK